MTDAVAPLDLLTTRQAGELLGLAGGYVGQLVNAGKLVPFAFAGPQRNALFLLDDIEAYAREREARGLGHTALPDLAGSVAA